MKKGYYIVLTHTYKPYADDSSKHNVVEKCEFVTRIKDRMLTTATVIMDAVDKKFIKNRVDYATYDQFESHVSKTHTNEWSQFVKLMQDLGIYEKEKENEDSLDSANNSEEKITE